MSTNDSQSKAATELYNITSLNIKGADNKMIKVITEYDALHIANGDVRERVIEFIENKKAKDLAKAASRKRADEIAQKVKETRPEESMETETSTRSNTDTDPNAMDYQMNLKRERPVDADDEKSQPKAKQTAVIVPSPTTSPAKLPTKPPTPLRRNSKSTVDPGTMRSTLPKIDCGFELVPVSPTGDVSALLLAIVLKQRVMIPETITAPFRVVRFVLHPKHSDFKDEALKEETSKIAEYCLFLYAKHMKTSYSKTKAMIAKRPDQISEADLVGSIGEGSNIVFHNDEYTLNEGEDLDVGSLVELNDYYADIFKERPA